MRAAALLLALSGCGCGGTLPAVPTESTPPLSVSQATIDAAVGACIFAHGLNAVARTGMELEAVKERIDAVCVPLIDGLSSLSEEAAQTAIRDAQRKLVSVVQVQVL